MGGRPFILAGDAGTHSIKAALFGSNLEMIAHSSCRLNTGVHPGIPGSVVQDPGEWVGGFAGCVDSLYRKAPDLFSGIEALALTGQMEDLIPLDGEGRPLCEALLYSDSRAGEEAQIIMEQFGMDELFGITGNEFNLLNSCAKLFWLKRKMPEIFSRTRRFLFGSKDYLNFMLTGASFTDYTTASTTGLLSVDEKDWDGALIGYLGLPGTSLPVVDSSTRIIGEVNTEWADTLHLKRGTPVLNGMGDAAAATAGAGVHQEGEVYIYGGTTGWVASIGSSRRAAPVYNLLNHDGSLYINVSPVLNAGNAIDWGIDTFYYGKKGGGISYDEVDAVVESTTPRVNLLFLPYLNGERSPFHDECARGMLFGLSLDIKSEDILRSIFEGVAFSLHHNLVTLQEDYGDVDEPVLPLTGGLSRLNSFCSILACISGKRIERLRESSSGPLFGTALVACQSLGLIKNKSIRRKVEREFGPEKGKSEFYKQRFEVYKSLYPLLEEQYRKLSVVSSASHYGG